MPKSPREHGCEPADERVRRDAIGVRLQPQDEDVNHAKDCHTAKDCDEEGLDEK